MQKVSREVAEVTGRVAAAAGGVGDASRQAQESVEEIKRIPGNSAPSPAGPSNPTSPKSTPPSAEDEVQDGEDEGDEALEEDASDEEEGGDVRPQIVKERLTLECESPLEGQEGSQVKLTCHVALPNGKPVAGVVVVFRVRDSAGTRDLGIATTSASGDATKFYRPSYNFRGRRASATLTYTARVEDSRRWYAASAKGRITLLRADPTE